MKIKLIIYINASLALAAILMALCLSDDFFSSMMLVFFTQFAACIAMAKYYHTRNILKAANDIASLKVDLSKNIAIILIFFCIMIFALSVSFFSVSKVYQIVIFASASVAIMLVSALYITMYPILVKFSAGVYKRMSD